MTEKYEKCYKRYERKEHKNKDLPKTCAKKLNILYFSYPPYIYFDREHKNVTGILPGKMRLNFSHFFWLELCSFF